MNRSVAKPDQTMVLVSSCGCTHLLHVDSLLLSVHTTHITDLYTEHPHNKNSLEKRMYVCHPCPQEEEIGGVKFWSWPGQHSKSLSQNSTNKLMLWFPCSLPCWLGIACVPNETWQGSLGTGEHPSLSRLARQTLSCTQDPGRIRLAGP